MLSMDLSAFRLVKVPDPAPPYDCEIHGTTCPALRDPVLSGMADPAAVASPLGLAEVADHPDPLRAVYVTTPASAARSGSTERPSDVPGPAGTGATAAWPRQFAQVTVEILAGVRPLRQAVPWATDDVLAQIRGLMSGFASDRRPKIQRMVATRPAANAVEMTVVAAFGSRTRALALRFEQIPARQAAPGLPPRPARWLCTALETG
jgi:hypothetical protein